VGDRVRTRGGFRPGKLVEFLEATYDFESDDPSWLSAVMHAAREVWGRGGPMHGAIYDASDVAAFRALQIFVDGFADDGLQHIVKGPELLTPELIARSFRSSLVSTSALALPEMGPMYDAIRPLGLVDTLYINGLDPRGHGLFFGIWTTGRCELPASELAVYRRMAHHLGAANRYRRRLRQARADRASFDVTDDAEAVLDARHRIVHAEGPAKKKDARAALIETSKARELARVPGPGAREGLRRWPPLTAARWTLVDSFERSGARYVVARENQSELSGLAALSERERQVVAYAALGQSTKETAYALGISDSTVRVLLARAAARLGAKTRASLLDHPAVRSLRPGGGTAAS